MALIVVELNNAWLNWQDTKLREMFFSILDLKRRGYGAEYPAEVLSVDTTDFVATHFAVCEKVGQKLKPLMAYRCVSKALCDRHFIPFSALSVVRSVNSKEHEQYVLEQLERCKRSGIDLGYDSSWTIDPETRHDKEKTKKLRDVMQAIHVLYHIEHGPKELMAAGATRFKMERLYDYWGYNRFAIGNKVLSSIKPPFAAHEDALMFHLQKFSDQALADAKKYEALWRSRMVLGADFRSIKLPEAA